MEQAQYFKNLTPPQGRVDVVLDTDAYNEVDDQYAIAYMLKCSDKFHVKGICAAPFYKKSVGSALVGMERSYDEILKVLSLMQRDDLHNIVYKGSGEFMQEQTVAVESAAADFMARLAEEYTPQNPLYIIAIGAITNVASAILKNPNMIENCVVVWLGGHGLHIPQAASEFNMRHDIAGARVLLGCGIPVVLLPCNGVVDRFAASKYELEHWLKGKNALCDYLYENTVREAETYAAGKPWTRVIWDVTAVAWLMNEQERFMKDYLIPSPVAEYDMHYAIDPTRHLIRYVYRIKRDALFEDLFKVLGK